MSDTLDTPVPITDASENETENFQRIVSGLARAGRAWAGRQADRALRKIESGAAGIMGAAGLDPPESGSLSPQWLSESRTTLEKQFLLNFYDRVGVSLLNAGCAESVRVKGGVTNLFDANEIFPHAFRAAPGDAEGGQGGVSDTEQKPSDPKCKTGWPDKRAEVVAHIDGPGLRQKAIFPAGTVVKVYGLPFALKNDVVVESESGNFKTAGLTFERKAFAQYPTAFGMPKVEE